MFDRAKQAAQQNREAQSARDRQEVDDVVTAEHAASLEQAFQAYQNGDRFLQVHLTINKLFTYGTAFSGGSEIHHIPGQADILGKIEEIGWHLEHAGFTHVGKGSIA